MQGTYRQSNGRNKFLEAVKTRNAEVLKTLHDQVLPIFKIATTNSSFIAQEWIETGPHDRIKTDVVFHPKYGPLSFDFERMGSSDRELLAVLALVEALANHRDAGDRELSLACKITEDLRDYIRKRPNEERFAFLKQWRDILAARGATEMYVAVGEEVDKAPIPMNPYPGVKWSEIESSRRPKLARVKAAISEWATRYNLTDRWILETVVQTLLFWMFYPKYNDRWAYISLTKITHPPRFQIEPRPFEPRKAFLYRANEELKAFYASSVGNLSDVGPDHKYAFEWLARFQTARDSPRKIAIEFERETDERRTPGAIILAIHGAADEIGLTLRQNLRGPGAKKLP